MGYFTKFVDENGDPWGVKHVSNKMRISAQPYLYDIAEGNMDDHYPLHKYGINLQVGTAYETVYRGGNNYTYITTATKLYFAGEAGVDRSDGVGARTVILDGLDGNYDELSETITMNGATAVPTTATFLRINDCYVDTAGSSGTNSGVITIKNGAGSTTYDTLTASTGHLQSAVWTVPANHSAYVTSLYGAEESNKGVEFDFQFRPYGKAIQKIRPMKVNSGFISLKYDMPIKLEEKTDIELEVKGTTVDAIVSAGFEGWYEEND